MMVNTGGNIAGIQTSVSQKRNLNGTGCVRLWETSTVINYVTDRVLPYHTNPHTFTSVQGEVWL
jgi:hypothetical protein